MDRKRKQLQNGPLFGRIFVSYFVLQEWQELEMKLDDKINKVEARNVQLEEKVHQLESQLQNQRVLNVNLSFIDTVVDIYIFASIFY